ncbi:MAG TPA: hypothetical protein VN581_05100, partial [Patescibacteria group bacterium]|nr:hypothetical protein [Patescibacteria group bacterium]
MPQLSSGRHVALAASPYLHAVASENDESKYFAIVAHRIHAGTSDALRDHLVTQPRLIRADHRRAASRSR